MQITASAVPLPPPSRGDGRLHIDAYQREADARSHGPREGILGLAIRHTLTVWKLRRRGVRLWVRGPETLRTYSAMSMEEFAAINCRQAWANWRTIPRSLDGRVPQRPVLALDLCCGDGASTAVLAWWLPPGSAILGFESDERLAQVGGRRRYPVRGGGHAAVCILARSVLEVFCDADLQPLATGSVQVVNSSGALGCHFTPEQSARVLAEVARVLAPGGHAFIDAGSAGTSPARMLAIASGLGLVPDGQARSCVFDRHPQVALRKPT
jgi:SAM-dependent methyltransferase